jgi:hypothetical protein
MKKPIPIVPLLLGFAGLCVALFAPFKAMGDAIGPGYADLMNGGAGMTLLLLAGLWAVIALRKR